MLLMSWPSIFGVNSLAQRLKCNACDTAGVKGDRRFMRSDLASCNASGEIKIFKTKNNKIC